MKIYIDGILLAERVSVYNTRGHGGASPPFNLGNGFGSFDGVMDDIMVWGRPLNANEVKDLYEFDKYDQLSEWAIAQS